MSTYAENERLRARVQAEAAALNARPGMASVPVLPPGRRNSIRDHLGTLRWRAANGRTRVSNAWYRAAGHRIQGTRTQFSNWRNGQAIARGRRDIVQRAADQARSRMPVVCGRVNPGTGRPHREDVRFGRLSDGALAASRDSAARMLELNRGLIRGDHRRQPARPCPYPICHHNHPELPERAQGRQYREGRSR